MILTKLLRNKNRKQNKIMCLFGNTKTVDITLSMSQKNHEFLFQIIIAKLVAVWEEYIMAGSRD